MSEHDRDERERRAKVERQDAAGVDVPAGKTAGEVAPEDMRPARPRRSDAPPRGGRHPGEDEPEGREVAASAHGEATPRREEKGVRPIGNTDVPVTSKVRRGEGEE